MITREKFNPSVFRDIVQSVPVGIVAVAASGDVESWNAAAERILGWSAADTFGHPLPIDLLVAPVDTEIELERCRKNGTPVVLQVRTIAWRDPAGTELGSLIILTDLTASRETETAIHNLEHREQQALVREREYIRFQELLEAAPDAIIEVDADGKIVLLNRVTEHLFGYKRTELLGQPVEVLIPDNLRANHHQHREEYRAHPSRRPMGIGLTLEGQRSNGSRFPVEISLSPVRSDEGFRVSAIIRDISDRLRTEETLRAIQSAHNATLAAKNRELEERNREVENANNLKSEFLSGMSHELRTPLHTIIGFTELLEEQAEGPLTEKQQRFVRHIHRDSQHLLALINDVLDLSKIESGRMVLQKETFPLSEALEDALSSLRPRGAAKGIEIGIQGNASIELYADRLRIRQILYNLLSNAVKFTPEKGAVTVEVSERQGFVEICVTDTGIGIPKSEQEAVFDKFYQVGQRQAGGNEGTGLGLAITRHLIEEHGGSIRLESEVGKGSRFTFTIPLQTERASAS